MEMVLPWPSKRGIHKPLVPGQGHIIGPTSPGQGSSIGLSRSKELSIELTESGGELNNPLELKLGEIEELKLGEIEESRKATAPALTQLEILYSKNN